VVRKKEQIYVYYHLQDGLLYKRMNIFLVKEERVQLIRDAYTSKVVDHFGAQKIVANL